MGGIKHILKDIKIEHTLFALPFAVMSAFIAAEGMPETKMLALLIIALFFARSAAMAFNRIADAKYDSTNPRTMARPLASGLVGKGYYTVFVIGSSAGFILTAWLINTLAFLLSPAALAVIFFYSLTKRFTPFSHFFLGLALSLAPVGAWIAVTGSISHEALILGLAVVFWLVGLDIIYSCQDIEHDTASGLKSIPSKFGVKTALYISSLAHGAMIVFLMLLYMTSQTLGPWFVAGTLLTAGLLWYEHMIVKPGDLKKVNVAFFNLNGMISVGLMVFVIVDTVV